MGRPKAWLDCAGEAMLVRVVRLLARVVDPVVVAARPGQRLPALPAHVSVVYDPVQGVGPLAGVAAGLTGLCTQCEYAVVTSCDAPLLRPAFVQRLIALIDGAPAVVVRVGGRVQPVPGVYAVALRGLASSMLDEPARSLTRFALRAGARVVPSDVLTSVDPGLESLADVDDPDAYASVIERVVENP